MEYKNITVREINGYTVTSKTCVLTPEEEEERLSKIKTALCNLYRSTQKKNPTV
jgi:hypothetical protein